MKLAICVPFYGFDCKSYFASSLLLTEWPQCEKAFFEIHGNTTSRAKLLLTDRALKWGATHILSPSADTQWPKDAVKRLVAHDKDVVSGWGKGRFSPFHANVGDLVDIETGMFRIVQNPKERSGLERVALYGELQLVKAEVFQKIPRPWFFGPDMCKGDSFMTEDTYFCLQAAKCGVEVWVDWDINVVHVADGLVTDENGVRSMQ